ncbi:hypothetical protein N7454_002903 [Penicillium verhagenii]|nr:hypothetical protein N7454_002903 [Penicillium verhagenii]
MNPSQYLTADRKGKYYVYPKVQVKFPPFRNLTSQHYNLLGLLCHPLRQIIWRRCWVYRNLLYQLINYLMSLRSEDGRNISRLRVQWWALKAQWPTSVLTGRYTFALVDQIVSSANVASEENT